MKDWQRSHVQRNTWVIRGRVLPMERWQYLHISLLLKLSIVEFDLVAEKFVPTKV